MGLHIVKNAASVGFGGSKPISNRHIKRFANRRKVLEGFPYPGKFETAEQISEYFAGDRVQCLKCGRTLKSLGNHLSRIHGVSEDAYKTEYGLPYTRGLDCRDTRNLRSTIVKDAVQNDPKRQAILEAGRKVDRVYMGRMPPYALATSTRRISQFNGAGHIYDADTAEEYLRRITDGRTPTEVSRDPDMPKKTWFRAYRRAHADFDIRYRAAVEELPFNVQSKMDSLGKRFCDAVIANFNLGLSDHANAKSLGVTAMACNAITKPLRKTT